METPIAKRIASLRETMNLQGMDAYILSGSDPHISEYPAARWKSREWISGFDGSAGTVVVTADKAGLWTDSRYFLQAAKQLEGTGIELYKMALPETPTHTDFLLHELHSGQTVGLDGRCYSTADALLLEGKLRRKGIALNIETDLLDSIWTDRPDVPQAPLFDMPVELSGKSVREKLNELCDYLHAQGADGTLLAALDEVAWTFNIRGTDVTYNPVAVAYAYVSERETVLFVNPRKLPSEVAERLRREGVILADYTNVATYLNRLPKDTRLFVDRNKTNIFLFNAIPAECPLVEGISPAAHLKSIKNETETAGFHKAMQKDGVALVRFFRWLEGELSAGGHVTELSAAAQLTAFRAEQPQYIMDSFSTICGYAEHGAIVHYSATPETDAVLKPEGLLLIDSGGQYLDGTTDITRTLALGEPTEAMKKDYTRVLKGAISLAKCKFPAGTRGSQIDILARKALWDSGLNYLHGTGHGIGHCLNVHEGPQSIRMEENPVPLKPGMVVSDEPGLYRANEYGIRIENLIQVREESETEFGKFLTFDTLTLCPIDTRPILIAMLSARERAWLNRYHQQVFDKLSPHLSEEEQEWLKHKTAEI